MATRKVSSKKPTVPSSNGMAPGVTEKQRTLDSLFGKRRRLRLKIAALRPDAPDAIALAAECAGELLGAGHGEMWIDFAKAIKGNTAAWNDLVCFATGDMQQDDLQYAAGFGMVAGIVYASITGVRLPPTALIGA